MKGKIKEILYVLKDIVIGRATRLTCREADKLLDYITNLQDKIKQYEDPEDLTLFHMWLDEKEKDKLQTTAKKCKQLQEENKNLKQINEEHRKLNGTLRKTINEAINCINHYATENDDYSKLYSTEEEELLEILQGSDE